jgi:hypothetical protein
MKKNSILIFKMLIALISISFLIEALHCKNLKIKSIVSPPRSAADLLGAVNSLITGSSTSNGSTILTLDGMRRGQAANENRSATTLTGAGVSATTKNSGLSGSDFTGVGVVRTATSGDNSAALGVNLGATTTDSQSANVIDVLKGIASSATATGTNGSLTVGKNSISDGATSTTVGTVKGDGVLAAATDSSSASAIDDKSAANISSGSAGGLLALNNGSAQMSIGLDNNKTVTVGTSTGGTSTSGAGNVSINGNGLGSTTSTSNSNVVITDLETRGEGVYVAPTVVVEKKK